MRRFVLGVSEVLAVVAVPSTASEASEQVTDTEMVLLQFSGFDRIGGNAGG